MEENIKEIFKKVKSGSASLEEEELMKTWLDKFNLQGGPEPNSAEVSDAQKLIWQGVQRELAILPLNKKWLWLPYISSAAAILVAVILFTFYGIRKANQSRSPTFTAVVQDKMPGNTKAHVTLPDGTSINIDEDHNRSLLEKAGIKIEKAPDGTVTYKLVAKVLPESDQKNNTIYTPRGGKFNLELPDGTQVMLNAASTLSYPNTFKAEERNVALSGEAYFHVTKRNYNGKNVPFFVKTLHQKIEVLGTRFNVSAYEDDDFTSTTLVDGKVAVNVLNSLDKKILIPGEQSFLALNSSTFKINKVNVEEATAWKDGRFLFEDAYLKDILMSLSRWYDVKVDLMDLPKTRYTIFISRDSKLSSVLKMLESTGNLKFRLINNTIEIN